MRAALGRVGWMVRKELRQVFRDPRMARLVIVAPIIQLLVFGYAVSTDVRHTPTIVLDHDQSLPFHRLPLPARRDALR